MKNTRTASIIRTKLLRRGSLTILFFVCIAISGLSGVRVSSESSEPSPSSQTNSQVKPVSRLINDAKAAGSDFQSVELFQRQTGSVATSATLSQAVKAGTVLHLHEGALPNLLNSNSQSLTLVLPTQADGFIELELVRVNIFGGGFKVVTSDSKDQPVPYEAGAHYWGVIKGIEGSFSAISVFKDEVMGFYSSPQDGNVVLGKLGGNNPQRDHILYAEKDLNGEMPFACSTREDNKPYSADELSDSQTNQPTRCVKIFLETDYDLFLNKGGVNETVNYVTGIFNQSAVLYNNEGLPTSISEIFVWTSPSPYDGQDSFTQLAQFQNFRTSFNGDVAELLDLESNQGGVAAGFDGFCNPNRSQSQCYSGIFSFFNDVPTYSWTVFVFTHELGHLFGSRHTHACVWNGNGTAIDGCSGFTEGGCPLPGIPGEGGTIMSYCHQQSVGINFTLGFGPQPGNVIRNRFNGASCLGTCGGGGNTYTTAYQSYYGYFVVAEGGGGGVVNCNRTAIGPWETFTLIDLNGGTLDSGDLVNIQSIGGYYVVAEGGGGDVVNANRTIPREWETFRIEKVFGSGQIGSGETISLQAYNGWAGGGGNYVVAEGGGGSVVNANRAAVGPWEMFTIHIW